MNETDEVLAVAGRRATAMMAADVEGVALLLDERCVYTHSSGLTDTKESYIAALRKQAYIYHAVETVAVEHAVIIGHLVILNSVMRVSMTVKATGTSVDRKIKVTEMWVRDQEGPGWKLLISHSTNLA
ncbi:nuclear transport factor 2 family protein [Luteibacter yeojuensis]|nr:nuclear transport factor 2 family protein [Luteibacter yeojuensis]